VLLGDVQTVPIGDSIVYARPVYIEGQGAGQFPRLRFVALAYGDNAVLVDFEGNAAAGDLTTVDAAMRNLVTQPVDTGTAPTEPTNPPSSTTTTTTPQATTPTSAPPGNVTQLLAQANQELAAADAARNKGDLAGYQAHVTRARQLIEQANRLASGG
jgi:uncharacterized membrane protein (UPF0182 family)